MRLWVTPLLLALLLIPAGAHAAKAKRKTKAKPKGKESAFAKVVRSDKDTDRIPGLEIGKTKVKMSRDKLSGDLFATVPLQFTADGRSLIADGSPLVVDTADKESQKVPCKVELTGKVTAVHLLAVGTAGVPQEEKLLLVADKWKEKESLLIPCPPDGSCAGAAGEVPPDFQLYTVKKTGLSRDTFLVAKGEREWAIGDRLCVASSSGKKACGKVQDIADERVLVKLKTKRKPWVAHDLAFVGKELPKVQPRPVAPRTETREVASTPPAAAPPPSAKSEVRIATKPDSNVYFFSVTPRFSSFIRNATDSTTGGTAKFDSSVNFGVDLQASMAWRRDLVPFIYLDVVDEGIAGLSAAQLDSPDVFLANVGLGLAYYPTENRRLLLSLGAGYHQRFEVVSASRTRFTLERVSLPKIMLRGAYEIYESGPFAAWFELGGDAYFAGNATTYSVQNGLGLWSRLHATRDLGKMQLRGGLFFNLESLKASVGDYSQKEFGLELGVGWGF